jgi:DNA-binding XRE family transcriptional regulator
MRKQYTKDISRILGITGWTQDHLADLLDVSTPTMNSWANGKSEPKGAHAEKLYKVFDEIVKPLQCQTEQIADRVEKKLLQ